MADRKPSENRTNKFLDRLTELVIAPFYRMNIARKLMLGYSVLLLLLVGISVLALYNLNLLNDINSSIHETDLPVARISGEMIDVILAQEFYVQRYLILKSPDVFKDFWHKEKEFNKLVEQLQALPGHKEYPIQKIVSLQTEYNYILSEAIGWIEDPESDISKAFEKNIKTQQEKIIKVIKQMQAQSLWQQNEKTAKTATIGRYAFKAAAFLCCLGLLFALTAAFIITRNISGAIKKLKHATGQIAEGDFVHRPRIPNQDELGDLADSFATMAQRLKQLEEMYLDTSPLTRLPGGIAIENVLNKRIESGAAIAFCLMDIDNFKAYNDHYGYAKGNDIIQATAEIISEAVARYGSENDFIGHIGGDDYVLITTPDLYPRICQSVIDHFDRIIPSFYDEADRKRGHIIGENRQGQEVKFPLATLSIAVVTNIKRKFKNHIQFGEVAAEMKEHAKTVAGSTYMVDQRGDDSRKGKKNRKLISLQDAKRGSKG
ncbi:MAG: diguanylate cyclase [Desulfobacterales bacterium]|jgi:GGDEF domain-containing protein/CHASE3 domain sensor protein